MGVKARHALHGAHEEMNCRDRARSHTLAYLRRLDEKLDRLHGEVSELRTEVGARFDRVEDRLGRIEGELLVLNGIVLRLEGREVETTA